MGEFTYRSVFDLKRYAELNLANFGFAGVTATSSDVKRVQLRRTSIPVLWYRLRWHTSTVADQSSRMQAAFLNRVHCLRVPFSSSLSQSAGKPGLRLPLGSVVGNPLKAQQRKRVTCSRVHSHAAVCAANTETFYDYSVKVINENSRSFLT